MISFIQKEFANAIKSQFVCNSGSSVFLGRIKQSAIRRVCSTLTKEITVPVPYGHLAAKTWGNPNGYPTLALHGWMDNCGTYDKLIPLLNNNLYIVALDFPGHGFSSKKPIGTFYTPSDLIYAVLHLTKFLGWPVFNIIGHSMGAELAQMFSAFFPAFVDKVVALDTIKPISMAPDKIPDSCIKVVEENLKIEMKMSNDPPIYEADIAAKRLMEGMRHEVTEESAKILLNRGAKLSDRGNGLEFTRDLRLKTIEFSNVLSNETMAALLARIKSEMLIIRSNNTHPLFLPSNVEYALTYLDIYRKNCKRFVMETVEGNHFVHLNNPERVAPIINNFLVQKK